MLTENEIYVNHKILELLKAYTPMKIGLVTSNTRELTHKILNRIGMHEFFDVIVTCDDVKDQKPHAEPYLLAARILNVNPDECLVLEDTDVGIESAMNAGMRYQKITFGG